MNCAEVEEQMSAYVMNELQNELHDKIEHHIRTCDSCYAWYCEVTEMAEIWSDERISVDGLNLVEPVLRQLQLQPQPQFPQMWIKQKERILQSRMVYVHYGLAASFTIALFQLGIFEHLGLGIVNNGILLSHQVQGLLQIFSTL